MSLDITSNAKTAYENAFKGNAVTFSGIRNEMRQTRTFLSSLREAIDKDLASLEGTFAKSYIDKKRTELMTDYNGKKDEMIGKMNEEIKDLIDSKRNAIVDFTMTPPDDDVAKILPMYATRSDVSPTEIKLLLTKASGNFLATKMIQEIADKNGIRFEMPFDVTQEYKQITDAESFLHEAIENIENDDITRYVPAEFYMAANQSIGIVGDLFDKLDSSTAVAVAPDVPMPTFKEKIDGKIHELEASFRENKDIHDFSTAAKLVSFRNENKDAIYTDAEKMAELENKFDSIIGAMEKE